MSNPFSRFTWAIAAALVLMLAMANSSLAERGITAGVNTPGAGARRVALVIGNADYKEGRLRNPVNDARAMAAALKDLGFKVIKGENLTYRQMRHKIIVFGDEINRGGVGLFYYAGHGIQARGENYLIPLGARISREAEVAAEGVSLNSVLARMEGARNGLNIVILDACRNNPYSRSFRSGGSTGLKQVRAPQGTFVAYATAPGQVADDGPGKNGLYTEELVRHLGQPGLPIEMVFKQVRVAVAQRSQGKQVPWDESSLMGNFVFKSGKTQPSKPIQLADSPGPKMGEVDQRKLKIQNLLKQANLDLKANRLTSPKRNNALERYREVLTLDPMNAQANAGLKQIVGKFVSLAQGRIQAGDLVRAGKFLDQAETIAETDPGVLATRDKLRAAKQKAESAEAQARRNAEAERREQRKQQEAERRRRQTAQAPERSADGRYTSNTQGVITDSSTGLQWYLGPDKNVDWYDAKKWVEGLTVAGGGWRMPSRQELTGISQEGARSQNNKYLPPIFKTAGWWVWSGETKGPYDAWFFDFNQGEEYWRLRNNDYEYNGAFAVRSRPKTSTKATAPAAAKPTGKRFTNRIGMEFVPIPAGSFMMGSPKSDEFRYDDEVHHRVTISKPFYMQTTEVTQGQWRSVMGTTPWSGRENVKQGCTQCPASYVNWNDAQEFVGRLNRKEGTTKYRLPTEAEWEYACRAGSTTAYSFGDDYSQLSKYAWYRQTTMKGLPNTVAQKPPNQWGLYDMHGNMWEWCQDWYGAYPSSAVRDPRGALSGTRKVVRSGGWWDHEYVLRSANRRKRKPNRRDSDAGFRVVRTY